MRVELGDQLGALRRVQLLIRKRLQQQVLAREREVDRVRAQPVAAGFGRWRIGLAEAAQHRQRQGVAVHAEEAGELAVVRLEGRHLPPPAAEQGRQPVEREPGGRAEQGGDRPQQAGNQELDLHRERILGSARSLARAARPTRRANTARIPAVAGAEA